MAVKQAKAVIVKKRWVPIIAPKMFNEQVIGETYLAEPAQAVKRTVSVSMMVLTGDPQRQNISLKFLITGVSKDVLNTELIAYSINPSAVRKMMRRGKEKVEDSFVIVTSDGKKVRVKPFLITRGRAKGSVTAALKKNCRAVLIKAVQKMTFQDFSNEVVAHKMQKSMMDALRKTYPLTICEIRSMELAADETAKIETPSEQQTPAEQKPVEQPKPAAEQPAAA